MDMRAWLRGSVLWAVVVAVVLVPGTAMASCAPPPPKDQQIQQADAVFVGTVEALDKGDTWATVRVEEVWKGLDLAPIVQVRGSAGHEGVASSVDRTYTDDTRYLFVIQGDSDGPPFSDDVCSGTDVWNEDFAQYRPADWREPVTGEDPDEPGDQPSPDSTPEADPEQGGQGSDVRGGEATPRDEVLTTSRRVGNGEGYDGRLLLAAAVGLLGLLALGWWVRRES